MLRKNKDGLIRYNYPKITATKEEIIYKVPESV